MPNTFLYENNDVQSNRSDIFIGRRRRPPLHLHAITNHLDHILLKLSDVFTYKLPAIALCFVKMHHVTNL